MIVRGIWTQMCAEQSETALILTYQQYQDNIEERNIYIFSATYELDFKNNPKKFDLIVRVEATQ